MIRAVSHLIVTLLDAIEQNLRRKVANDKELSNSLAQAVGD